MNRKQLTDEIRNKRSFLCIGLDPDLEKIPAAAKAAEDPIFEFNKAIVDATAEFCVSYKPNTAFYEAYGIPGMQSLEKTINYIKQNFPNHFVIADAKRGDIGNTSGMYAKAFFEHFNADAVTIAPYMGSDSVKPFLKYPDKWSIVLGLTSNEGAADFQQQRTGDEELYMTVIRKCASWGNADNMMFVVGATKAQKFAQIRKIVPEHFLLVPGVGAQGGDLDEVCRYGLNSSVGLLINSSRGIIYASSKDDFAQRAAEEAKKLAAQMGKHI